MKTQANPITGRMRAGEVYSRFGGFGPPESLRFVVEPNHMRILSLTEHAAWMAAHKLPAKPYEHGGEAFESFLQFHAPKTFRSIECFTEALLDYAGTGGEAMVTIVDTVNPYDYEERLFNRLRFPGGEPKSIPEAPAHLFDANELADLIPIFSLTVGWQWQAYLHMPRSRTVLHNWEGELFDLWTDDRAVLTGLRGMLETFGLGETEPAPPGNAADPAPPGG